MRKVISLLGLSLFAGCLQAQVFSADELLSFAGYSQKKFDQFVTKRGYIPSGHFLQRDSVINTWDQIHNPTDSLTPFIHRRVLRYQTPVQVDYAFQTSSMQEAISAIAQMRAGGFTLSDTNWNMQKPLLLQMREWVAQAEVVKEDTTSYILLRWRKQPMPQNKKLVYANDLLQFHSDEYLATYFGRENVRKDQFYFSDNEIRKCSVLFPNTANQAIFIWEDEKTLIGLEQIMIGGSLRTENISGHSGVVSNNTWQLENGIRTHMRMEQILNGAGQDLEVYGRNSDMFLMLTQESAKLLDMEKVALIFECINCSGASLLDKEKLSATEASRQGLRLHVSIMILWPDNSQNRAPVFSSLE